MRDVGGRLTTAVAAVLCGLWLGACGSGSGGGNGGGTGSGVIGVAGGTVSLPDGPTVAVPAGALTSSTTVTVGASSVAAPVGAVSAVYQFGPDGTTFAAPVTVSFPVPAGTKAANVAVYWTRPGSSTLWDVLPVTVSGTVATASVTHFSAGFVGAACAAGAACTPPNPCHTGTTTCNGTPTCVDTGTSLTDGAACGGGNVCSAGVCGAAASCVDLAGAWLISAHCDSSYLGKSVTVAQTGCTATTTDPVTGAPATLQVTGSSVAMGSTCSGSVTGNAWDWHCGTCNQSLARQAPCIPGATCTPPGTPDACKSYATSCDGGGAQTCAAAGNKVDLTPCGSGLTCVAGTCGPVPSAPTGVTAQAGNGQVTISWDAVQGATSYNVYWSTSAGVTIASGAKFAGAVSPSVQAGLTNGTTYFYVVTAVNAHGESTASSQVSAAPAAPAGTYTIAGTVTGPWVEGVTVTLGGAGSASVTTDAAGHYGFAGLRAGSYTVTPSLPGYGYTPAAAPVALSASLAGLNFTATPTLPSYSVSGTVTYAGTKLGRTHVMATCTSVAGCYVSTHPGMAGSPTAATSIATAGGAYTIRGLAPGSYSLTAAIDAQGSGFFNGNDPSGTSSFTITSGNLANVNLVITDPVVTTPPVPAIMQVTPLDGGALIEFSGSYWGPKAETSYRLYWGTDAGATSGTPVTFPVAQAEDVPWFFHAGLTNGQALYYRLSALNSAGESAPSPVVGPITIGGTGPNTVSGTLTLPMPATGPVFVGLYSTSLGFITGAAIPRPTGTRVPYSVAGVPDGAYGALAWVDMNGDGTWDLGDVGVFLGNCGSPSMMTPATVSGNTAIDATLATTAVVADVQTQHYRSSTGAPDSYSMTTAVQGLYKLPVAATLYSGPGVRVPLDMATNQMNLSVQCGQAGFSLNGVRPMVGDTYGYQVRLSDGTVQNIAGSVGTVLDSFATNLGQTTTAPYSRNVPLLTWAAPVSPPASYTYAVSITGPDNTWRYYRPAKGNRIPSTTTSVQFNVDGKARGPSLTTGVQYTYEVEVQDGSDNSAVYRTTYTP